VRPDDELPKLICATCFIKIESIDKFSYIARKTEENFLTWLRKSKLVNDEDYLTQTIVETSTNSDFSFNNITIKKEIKQNEQQHKIIYKTYRNPRNPRYVDHITLEQIINDQIVKNPKMSPTTIVVEDRPPRKKIRASQEPPDDNSVVSSHYPNVLLGQMIKDQELLKLMLKALKWAEYDKNASYEELLERLKQTNSREILTNKNLLNDNDVMLLLKSYTGNNTNLFNVQKIPYKLFPTNYQAQVVQVKPQNPEPTSAEKPKTINRPRIKYVERKLNFLNENVTRMEVGLDPSLFLLERNEAGGSIARKEAPTPKEKEVLVEDNEGESNLQISKVETLSKTDLNKNMLKSPVKVVKLYEASTNKIQAYKIVKTDKGTNTQIQNSIKLVEKPKVVAGETTKIDGGKSILKTYSRKDQLENKKAEVKNNEEQVDLSTKDGDTKKPEEPEIKEDPEEKIESIQENERTEPVEEKETENELKSSKASRKSKEKSLEIEVSYETFSFTTLSQIIPLLNSKFF
jgi:hypothetical protein